MNGTIEKIHGLLEPLLDNTDMFIVGINIKPTNNIKVYIDADGGFSIEKCIVINKRLYSLLEDEAMYPDGDFSLEISSPGIDEPLLQWRQYKKNTGRKVTVTDNENKETTGMLTEVTEEKITLEVKKPKEKTPSMMEIPFSDIKTTIVQIIF
ncbi:MAG: ribosome maturation factor [Taibaiella sp.]|nr:ribosome maturation factor [Taibaiella sp.]